MNKAEELMVYGSAMYILNNDGTIRHISRERWDIFYDPAKFNPAPSGGSVGEIVGSRITSDEGVSSVPHAPGITQIAVLIKAVPEGGN